MPWYSGPASQPNTTRSPQPNAIASVSSSSDDEAHSGAARTRTLDVPDHHHSSTAGSSHGARRGSRLAEVVGLGGPRAGRRWPARGRGPNEAEEDDEEDEEEADGGRGSLLSSASLTANGANGASGTASNSGGQDPAAGGCNKPARPSRTSGSPSTDGGTDGDEVGSDVEGDKPLDAGPSDDVGASLAARWAHERRSSVSIVADACTLRTRQATVENFSAVFGPEHLHLIHAPSPGHCEALFECLTGDVVVDDGSVLANGAPLTVPKVSRLIAAVPAFDAAIAGMSVRENVTLAARLRMDGRYRVGGLVADILMLLGIGSFRHNRIGPTTPALVRFLVNVAMEIVAAPIALVVRDPFRSLNGHEQNEAAAVFERVARVLQIPVIVVATDVGQSLLLNASGSLAVVSDLGTLFYSGPVSDASQYFAGMKAVITGSSQPSVGDPPAAGEGECHKPVRGHGDDDTFTAVEMQPVELQAPPLPAAAAATASMATKGASKANTSTGSAKQQQQQGSGGSCDAPSNNESFGRVSSISSFGSGEYVTTSGGKGKWCRGHRIHFDLGPAGGTSHARHVVCLDDIVNQCRARQTSQQLARAFSEHSAATKLHEAVVAEGYESVRRGDVASLAPQFETDDGSAGAALGRCGSCLGLRLPSANYRTLCRRWAVRFVALMQYAVLQQFRRAGDTAGWIALWLSFILCAFLASRQGGDEFGMMNKRGIVFFLLSAAMHVNSLFVHQDVAHRHAMAHLRQRRLFAPATCWVSTLLRVALPRIALGAGAYIAALAYFEQVHGLPLLVTLVSFAHALALALWLWAFPSPRLAGTALGLYYLYAVFFSGFLVTASSRPHWPFALSLLRPAYGGSVADMMRGRPVVCDAVRANHTLSYCFSGDRYLEIMGLLEDSYTTGWAELTVFSSILAFLLLVAVHVR
jgi:ABC-type multidrug transport system ATPase subunit